METTTIQNPEPSGLSKSQISDMAENIALKLGYHYGGDIEKIVKDLGGKILYQDIFDLDSSDSGSIVINNPTDFEITLALHTSKERDRFTIAHELGHYFLHYLLYNFNNQANSGNKKFKASRYGSGKTETEAHWFAASFLMPEESFKEEFHKLDGNYIELAEKFGVSLSACKVRAESLNLSVTNQ